MLRTFSQQFFLFFLFMLPLGPEKRYIRHFTVYFTVSVRPQNVVRLLSSLLNVDLAPLMLFLVPIIFIIFNAVLFL